MSGPAVTEDVISASIDKHADMVRRICYLSLKNPSDVEDVFQEVFLKFFQHYAGFQNEQHQKAWLCRVAFNQCKDANRKAWFRRTVSIDEVAIPYETPEEGALIQAVSELSLEYRQLIFMHYYEGFSVNEISAALNMNANTVYTKLRRARESLKSKLGGL